MSETVPPVFDVDVVDAVSERDDVDRAALESGLVAVQAVVSGFADLSVDDIVYEWRTRHHQDPFVARTPDAYYLAVRDHVWTDVIDRGDVDGDVVSGVRAVHSAQFEADREGRAPEGAMVLDRS